MPPRHQPSPPLLRSERASLHSSLHGPIDGALKTLRLESRQLQATLVSFSDELAVLRRILYKAENEHRSALFWRRVQEMKRFAGRLEEMSIHCVAESLRCSFFPQEAQSNPKLLKGSWTHFPDEASFRFTLKRLQNTVMLLKEALIFFNHACKTCAHLSVSTEPPALSSALIGETSALSLAMQSGAFIHLILTLTALAARLDQLTSDLVEHVDALSDTIRLLQNTLRATPISVAPPEDASLQEDLETMETAIVEVTRTVIVKKEKRRIPKKPILRAQDEIDAIFG
ncbi:unnamed protein product [Mycena citricolor]|uniref:Uncharacterized protein n=1 Tax=Mycena citricolor TaxID=2018698 RepID=A0AAD2GWW3_9AGAR|nr:unnamed protein product [Mycena citricolor]